MNIFWQLVGILIVVGILLFIFAAIIGAIVLSFIDRKDIEDDTEK